MMLRMSRDILGQHVVMLSTSQNGRYELLYTFRGAQVSRKSLDTKDLALAYFGEIVAYLKTKRKIRLTQIVMRG